MQAMDEKSKVRALKAIEEHMSLVAPEFLKALNRVCLKSYGSECASLLLEEPARLRDLLLQYNDERTTKFVVKNLFLRPLLKPLGAEDLAERLAEDFIRDASRFRSELRELLGS